MTPDHKLWVGLSALMVAGLGFLWPPYASRMWNSGHYQFFVFVFAIVAWLLWSRRSEIIQSRTSPNVSLVFFFWLSTAGLIAFGNITYSGLVGILTTILVIAGGVYSLSGSGGLRTAGNVLWLLGFAIPLPLMLDQALIMKMQVLASELASRLLDGGGVVHFRNGVIIETPQAKFMTEEACSGIRSLFSSMAVVSIYGVASRHPAWRIAINLAQTVLWVLVGNSLRVAIVVALAGQFPWVASGWGHEALGLGVFGFILAMVASTDVALSRWISDWFVVDIEREPPDIAPADPYVLPPFPVSGARRMILFAALTAVLMLSLRTAWVRLAVVKAGPSPSFIAIADPLEGDFEGQYAGFVKQSFTLTQRTGNALWAENSFLYRFKRNHLEAVLSIDRPWDHWHNLHICYTGIGWESTPNYAISATESNAASHTGRHKHSELMLKRSGRYGFVIFSAVDRLGAHVPETAVADAVGLAAASRLQPKQLLAALGFESQKVHQQTPIRLPVSTIQVYTESTAPLSEEDLDQIRELFFTLREEIVSGLIVHDD